MKRLWRFLIFASSALLAASAAAAPLNVTIYFGNSPFAFAATDPGSPQGFTFLRDRWASAGANVSLTDSFSPAGQDIFFITDWGADSVTASQALALRAFLLSGGLLIVSHTTSFHVETTLNHLMASGLGSSMRFGTFIQGAGMQTINIVDPDHPLMEGMPDGPTLTGFAPFSVTGGEPLAGLASPIVSIEATIQSGHILAVADSDLLSNTTDLFVPTSARPNNHQFWDNIIAFQGGAEVPEPGTLLLLGTCVVLAPATRRRAR